MKKIMLTLLSALVVPLLACADNYKILYLNSSTIKIGNRVCQTGDVFDDGDVIFWTTDKQAFKAQNTTSKTIRLYAAPDFRKTDSKTIRDYMFRKGHLSTRSAMSLSELETYLSDEFFLLDSISVESTEMTDSHHYFVVSYQMDGKTVKKKLKGNHGELVITRSLFPESASVSEFTLTVSYVNKKIEDEYLLTNTMKIVLLPLNVDEL